MPRTVQFVTPENIDVSYELAGIGSRFVAALIDHVLQIVVILVIGLVLARAFPGRLSGYATALATVGGFLVLFGYFSLFEILWNGRTPGKRATRLRVMRDTGYPVDPYASIVRNLVRIVDFALPPPYGAGILSIFLSRDYKRLGDFAAGTIVVKERAPGMHAQQAAPPLTAVAAVLVPFIKDIDALTGDEFQLIHAFVLRSAEMEPNMRAYTAMRIALPLLPRLGVHVAIPVQSHYVDLLQAVDRLYVEQRGVLEGGVAAEPAFMGR